MNLANLGCEVHVFSPVDKSYKITDNLIVHGVPSYQFFLTSQFHRFLRDAFKNSFTARHLYTRRALEFLSKRLAEDISDEVKRYHIDVLQGEKEIASMTAITLGKRLGIPVIADIHGLLVEESLSYGFLKNDSKECLESRAFVSDVLDQSDGIVVVSENLKHHLVENFSIGDEKIFVIPNAGTFKGLKRQLRPMAETIIYAGILEPWERVDLAISSIPHVVKVHRKVRFFIAGAGSLKRNLIKLVNNLGVNDYVSFAGTIAYDKVGDFLAQGDVAVLPSTVDLVRRVACPIKLFNYLASGLPVVTVDRLWWSDFVRSNDVGLVADDNPESFGNAINELLSSPEKINSMGEKAISLVQEKYNWTEMAKNLLEVYERVL